MRLAIKRTKLNSTNRAKKYKDQYNEDHNGHYKTQMTVQTVLLPFRKIVQQFVRL